MLLLSTTLTFFAVAVLVFGAMLGFTISKVFKNISLVPSIIITILSLMSFLFLMAYFFLPQKALIGC